MPIYTSYMHICHSIECENFAQFYVLADLCTIARYLRFKILNSISFSYIF